MMRCRCTWPRKGKRALSLCVALVLFAMQGIGGERICLENDAIAFRFDDAAHGFAVLGVSNKLAHTYYSFDGTQPWGRLFSIDFRRYDDLGNATIESTASDRCAFAEKTATRTEDGIEFAFKNFLGGGKILPRGLLDVYVRVRIEPDCGRTYWTLEYDNRSTNMVGFVSRFPRFNEVMKDDEGDFLVPWSNHGMRLLTRHSQHATNRCERLEHFDAGYLGYKPMVTAFLKGGGGVYMAAEDPAARIKELSFRGHYPFFTTYLAVKRPPEGRNGPCYPVALAAFRGDWWQVARLYRAWALKQAWTAQGRLIDRADYPHRLCEIPYWVNMHASGPQLDRWIDAVRKDFPNFRIGLHWHRWHTPPHCRDYPEYFPARTGVVENVRHLKRINVEGNVYLDSQLWTEGVGDWSNAVRWATLRANGRDFNYERWAGVRNAVMCPATPFWQNTVRAFSRRVFDELGSDSIYQDQTAAAPARTCYDPRHGHALGGGDWWYRGYRQMFAPLKARAVSMGGVITTEGTGEVYMPFVDGFLMVTDLENDDVPFYNAVYSGYAYYYGSPQSTGDDDASFWAVQTREFLWGNALGWYDEPNARHESKRRMVRRLCAARIRLKDYFSYGQLVDEMRPVDEGAKVPFRFRFRANVARTMYLPKVNGCWWRNGRDGRLALVAVNLTEEPQVARVALPEGVKNALAVALAGESPPEMSLTNNVVTVKIAPRGLVSLRAADTD